MSIQKKSSFSLASFLEKLPGDFFSHTEVRPHSPAHLSGSDPLLCLQEDDEDDSDLSDYGDEPDGKKDALAEPCFMLIGEIFELRGSEWRTCGMCRRLRRPSPHPFALFSVAVFKWVRKTLIALVQVTFGRTINKLVVSVFMAESTLLQRRR